MSSKEKSNKLVGNSKVDESEIYLKDKNLYLMKNKKQYFNDNRYIIIILLINAFILFFSLIIILINKIKTNDILEIKNQINNLELDNFEKRNTLPDLNKYIFIDKIKKSIILKFQIKKLQNY